MDHNLGLSRAYAEGDYVILSTGAIRNGSDQRPPCASKRPIAKASKGAPPVLSTIEVGDRERSFAQRSPRANSLLHCVLGQSRNAR